MHRRALVLPALLPLLLAPALTTTAQDAEEEFTWSGAVAGAIEIQNLNGAISAEAASGDLVEVIALKQGPAADIAQVRIDVVEHDGGVTLCTVYPDDGDHDNVCGPGDDSDLSGTRKNKTRVSFEVRVPAGVEFVGHTMNGKLTASGMRSNLRLLTMNGAITADSSGWVRARTMNGAVDVAMGAADWTGTVEIESMNGALEVTLPGDAAAHVDARTMNGRVSSDWDSVEARGRRRNRASGTLGAGGRDLTLSTMNGSIRLRRSR